MFSKRKFVNVLQKRFQQPRLYYRVRIVLTWQPCHLRFGFGLQLGEVCNMILNIRILIDRAFARHTFFFKNGKGAK